MAFLIDQLNNSGLFAQSAYSAGIATCDSDGNVITATYLSSHQPISANEWNSSYETVLTNSASWSGGTVESYDLSAGDNIQITKDDVNSAIGIAVTGLNQTNWNNSYTALTSNSAIWNTVTDKLDATAYTPFDPTFMSGAIDNKLDTTAFSDVSGTFLTAHQSLDGYATTAWVDSQGYLTAHQPISADEWNNVYDTVQTNSGSWTGGGGGSIDTIPFIVQSPLTTGISGYSAYIGLDGEAFESSAYVPFSALTDNGATDGRVHTINGSGLFAVDASHSNFSDYATYDNEGTSLTDTKHYADEAYNTVQSNSANWGGGGTPISGLELSAGDYITIVDDIPNSASIISVTGLATTGDLNYVSGVVGDVENLLAQL